MHRASIGYREREERCPPARRSAHGWAALLLIALAGCAHKGADEAEREGVAASALTGSTYDFVVSSVTIDPDDTSPAAGFNFDGLYTTKELSGCQLPDRVSDLDTDQNSGGCDPKGGQSCQGGVDNMLPQIVTLAENMTRPSLRDAATTRLVEGQMIWLVRLEGVDSLLNDSSVQVTLYRGYSTDLTCEQFLGGSGAFLVDNASLVTAGNLAKPLWTTTGHITSGRLFAQFGTSTTLKQEGAIQILGHGAFDDVPIYQLHLRVSLAGDGSAGTNGNAGAWAYPSDVSKLVFGFRTTYAENALVALLSHATDLDLAGKCGTLGEPATPAIGLGARFGLVHANIKGTTSTPPTGVCGTPGSPQ